MRPTTGLRRAARVLRDGEMDRELARTGFVVTRLVDAATAATMRAEFGALHGWHHEPLIDDQPPDFEISVWDDDPRYQAGIERLVDDRVEAAVGSLFPTHRIAGRSVMVKWPARPDQTTWGGVPDTFHNDSACVDERTGARAYRIWLALEDIDEGNGGLQVVAHSHRLGRPLRGWGIDAPWLSYTDVYAARAPSITLRAGEAVLFDPALIHRSGPNRTERPRVAASILLSDPKVPLCIFRRRDESTAERVDVSPTFLSDGSYRHLEDLPASEVLPFVFPPRSEPDIARWLDRLSRPDRARDRIRTLVETWSRTDG